MLKRFQKVIIANIILSVLLVSIVSSCSKTTDPNFEENPEENVLDTTMVVEEEVEQIIIDSSDLFFLPIDIGGTHEAFPLDSTDDIFGHYVYTPSDYDQNDYDYPLIVFLHGWGERGDSKGNPDVLKRVTAFGPPKLISNDLWKPSFPSIVVSPQLVGEYWKPAEVHAFIQSMIKKYKVNTKRIYLTGLSLGGGGCWFYVGENGPENYAAAIVPISSSGSEFMVQNLLDVPIWAFHGSDDQIVDAFDFNGSVPMVNLINQNSPRVKAKVSVFSDTGHDAWSRTYNSQFTGSPVLYNKFEVSIYDWMFQYKKE